MLCIFTDVYDIKRAKLTEKEATLFLMGNLDNIITNNTNLLQVMFIFYMTTQNTAKLINNFISFQSLKVKMSKVKIMEYQY